MEKSAKCFLQQLVRRTPTRMLKATLEKWDRLTPDQRQSVDFTLPKWVITQTLVTICEENGLTMKHITELEMMHVLENPNQGTWYSFQLLDPEDDAHSVELMRFKEQFKTHLRELMRNVSIKMKKHTDEAVWIRIAWGSGFSRPNHLKPTYVVHYLQSPYVFVRNLTSKLKPLLMQALTLATRHQAIKDANLSGPKLMAIRDLLMKQYQQSFPTNDASPLLRKTKLAQVCSANDSISQDFGSGLHYDSVFGLVVNEQAEARANRRRMASEAFGKGAVPQLQSAVYKLETKYRDPSNRTMTERDEPFRCVVKYSSSNVLESLRHCASAGIASTPVTPPAVVYSLKRKELLCHHRQRSCCHFTNTPSQSVIDL